MVFVIQWDGWIIFIIIILNSFSGRLPTYSSFIWSGGFLPCSFIYNIFFCHLIFFDGWDCVPVLLVVWPEASSSGVCRQLDRVGSWCQDEELQEIPLWLIFSGVWCSVSSVVWTWCSHHRSLGPTPGTWIKILQVLWWGKKKNGAEQ